MVNRNSHVHRDVSNSQCNLGIVDAPHRKNHSEHLIASHLYDNLLIPQPVCLGLHSVCMTQPHTGVQVMTQIGSQLSEAALKTLRECWGDRQAEGGVAPPSDAGWRSRAAQLSAVLSAHVQFASDSASVVRDLAEDSLPQVKERSASGPAVALARLPSLSINTINTWHKCALRHAFHTTYATPQVLQYQGTRNWSCTSAPLSSGSASTNSLAPSESL